MNINVDKSIVSKSIKQTILQRCKVDAAKL